MVESSGTLRDSDLRGGALRQYAQISRLAVLSLVLALLGVLMVPLPFAVACAILAIRRIRASKGGLVGLPVAVAGLVVAAAMTVGWGWYFIQRQAWKRDGIRESKRVVAEFFDYTRRGLYDDAFALLSPDGKAHVTAEALKGMQGMLIALGKTKRIELKRTWWRRGKERAEVAEMLFEVDTEKQTLHFKIVIVDADGEWRIDRLERQAPPAPPSENPTA